MTEEQQVEAEVDVEAESEIAEAENPSEPQIAESEPTEEIEQKSVIETPQPDVEPVVEPTEAYTETIPLKRGDSLDLIDFRPISETSIHDEHSEYNINLNEIESIVVDSNVFAPILFSDDTIHPEPPTKRILDSPKPTRNYDFINTDYDMEGEFRLDVGLVLSRSGSLESLPTGPAILFSAIDHDREFPRTDTPTHLNLTIEEPVVQPEESPVAAVVEPEVLEEHTVYEEKIDREEVIRNICKDLELKEKLSARHIILQNKLSEHFKRKRVTSSN